MLLPVIMAGGAGSRLWPLSRKQYPKQFLPLISNETMLQETINRLENISDQAPFLVCGENHRFIVAEQLRQKGVESSGIILEPVGRNTAPAIAIAALHAINSGNDPLLLVLAADHVIGDQQAFTEAVSKAIAPAEDGKLITFGIVPTSPETGYGYIKEGKKYFNTDASFVDEFVEKPNAGKAKQYIDSGDYLWNSGMFLFRASRYLEELERYSPKILNSCKASLLASYDDLDFIRLDKDSFMACPDDSIDYAVMEKTKDAIVIPMSASWSDVGSFSSLWEVSEKDSEGNVCRGDIIKEQTSHSYIYAQNRLVATVGVTNLAIVETKDAVLVASIDRVQDVKSIVNNLQKSSRKEYYQNREVYRPWGAHDEIAEGSRFQVKYILVKPGEKTATQLHYHRAEHWVVVSGTARVVNGDKIYLLGENESTYIPIGAKHSIENPGKVPLELIEVRSGAYLLDDDVVRLEDYGTE